MTAPQTTEVPAADEAVEVLVAPEDAPATARKLLAAAGDRFRAVRVITNGFQVPASIAEAAGLGAVEQALEVPEKPAAAKRGNATGKDPVS